MTTARRQQVCLDTTPWYHCTTRCVRRAFICGFDALTNRDYSHRRSWIENRILLLAKMFCIDVGAYAVLSNHYHVVVRVDRDGALALTDVEVVQRWLMIYSGTDTAQRFNNGEVLSKAEALNLSSDIKHWRSELANLSRFMAEINQNIARRANREDDCKGRFFEARFDSQAILDHDALVRTMVYVDLNPVRAKIADTPEESPHTSVHRRIVENDAELIPFKLKETVNSTSNEVCLPISFDDYLTLLDWTGRQIQHEKRGKISSDAPSIFQRLNYSPEQWLNTLQPTITWKQKALGSAKHIKAYCKSLGQNWIWQATEHVIRT